MRYVIQAITERGRYGIDEPEQDEKYSIEFLKEHNDYSSRLENDMKKVVQSVNYWDNLRTRETYTKLEKYIMCIIYGYDIGDLYE
jgi:hypothetical protein